MSMDPRALRLVPAAGAAWVAAALATFVPASAMWIAMCCWGSVAAGVAVLIGGARLGREARRVRNRRGVLGVTVVALAFAATAGSTVAFATPARSAATEMSTERALEVTVQVTGKPERSARGWRADGIVETVAAGVHVLPAGVPVTLLLEERPEGLDVGARIHANATAFPADPGERAVLVVRIRASGAVVDPPTGVLALFADLRASLVTASASLPSPGGALIPGLAVGDTSRVDEALDESMKAASLSHLTAVSGANCAVVVGLAFLGAAAVGMPRAGRVAAGMLALGGFVVLVTPEPSVVRAATMAAVAMLAVLLGRRGAGLSVLALSVATLLAGDPWLASSLGFALSVAATAALLVLAEPLAHGLERFLPRMLAVALAVPVSAQIVCGPLIVLVSPAVSLYGVAANVIAAPAAPAATVIGLAACLAAPLPRLQAGLAALAWVPAAWIAATAAAVASLPGATLPWTEGLPGLVTLAAAGVAITVLLLPPGRRRVARAVRRMSALGVLVGAGVLAGTVVVATVVVPMRTPHDWRIAMCDVGQGDAVLVRSAGRVVLFDTGPDPEQLAACLTRLGIDRLDVVVLTHFDLDHVGGVDAIVGRVDLLLHGPVGEAQDSRTLARIEASRVVEAEAGMRGALGTATWRVLWPAGHAFPPGNDASVVLEIDGPDVPRTILLGDLGADAQQALRVSDVLRPPYRVVKLAHHGSADQDPALYAALGADLALIPVGVDNDYDHPRDDALRMLQGLGISVARTDRDGLVLVGTQVDSEGERVTLWRDRSPPDVGGAG